MNPLFLMFLISLIDIMGFGMLLPTMPYVAVEFGAPYWAATFIVGLYSLGQFISAPFWGRLSDKLGRRKVLMYTTAGFAFSYVLIAIADQTHSLLLLVSARFFSGLMAGNISAAFAYVADITTEENRAKGMGAVGAAFGLGFILGPALGGLLGGSSAATATLFWPAIASFIAAAVNFLLIVFLLKESLTEEQKARAQAEGHMTRLEQFRKIAVRPVLTRMMIMVFLYNFAAGLFELSVPYFTSDLFKWGPSDVGLAMAGAGLTIAIVQGGLIGKLTARFGEAKLLAFGASVYALLLIAQSQNKAAALFMIMLCVMGASQSLFSSPMTALISKRAGDSERGLVQGVQQSAVALARVVGPSLAGLFYGIYHALPMIVGFCLMVTVLGIYAGIRNKLEQASVHH